MCLLTFFPAGRQPDLDALYRGTVYNDDGHGWAVAVPSEERLIVFRALKAETAVEEFAKIRADYPDGPAMFHSRMTTHGTTDIENCHPFFVSGSAKTVVAHNGIFPTSCHPVKGDWRSDTRVFAEDMNILRRWGSLDSKATRRRMGRWMGPGNKVVILSVDPKLAKNAYMVNSQYGEWQGGIWYSNNGYRPYLPVGGWSTLPRWRSDRDEDDAEGLRAWFFERRALNPDLREFRHDCTICFTKKAVDVVTEICTVCLYCNDCYSTRYDCMCYSPSKLDTPATSTDAPADDDCGAYTSDYVISQDGTAVRLSQVVGQLSGAD